MWKTEQRAAIAKRNETFKSDGNSRTLHQKRIGMQTLTTRPAPPGCALLFGQIHGVVGVVDQAVDRIAVVELGDADGDGDRYGTS